MFYSKHYGVLTIPFFVFTEPNTNVLTISNVQDSFVQLVILIPKLAFYLVWLMRLVWLDSKFKMATIFDIDSWSADVKYCPDVRFDTKTSLPPTLVAEIGLLR